MERLGKPRQVKKPKKKEPAYHVKTKEQPPTSA
jgi:hypothetical protein